MLWNARLDLPPIRRNGGNEVMKKGRAMKKVFLGLACVAGLAGTQAPIRGYAATNVASVAAGASRVFCLEMAITPGAPSTVAGQSLAFTMTVSGLQSAS